MVKVETGIIKTENMSKASFNIPNLDKNLDGGIPYSSNVLLVGQPMSGKSTFGLQFVTNGIKCGDSAIVISTNALAEEIRNYMQTLGFDPHAYEEEGSLKFIDCYSSMIDADIESTSSIFRIPSIIDMTKIIIVTTEILTQFWQKQKPIRIVYDSISALLMYTNVQTVTRFLHVFMGKL